MLTCGYIMYVLYIFTKNIILNHRSLKLWFVLRTYGITGLQNYIRHHCQLAKRFERLVRSDNKYEILNDVKVNNV